MSRKAPAQRPPKPFPETGRELGPLVVRAGGHGTPRVVTPAGLGVVERLAREGLSDTSIAAALRIDRETFRQLRMRQQAVEEALACGRSGLEDELTDLLLQRARDPKHPGGTVAAIFLAKARCGWREGELPQGATVINADAVQINMPAALTDEQFRALLARGGAPLPPPPPPGPESQSSASPAELAPPAAPASPPSIAARDDDDDDEEEIARLLFT